MNNYLTKFIYNTSVLNKIFDFMKLLLHIIIYRILIPITITFISKIIPY